MSKLTENKRAGLYMRLSQEDERAGESQSIENQKTILEKYALDNGFEVVDEYIEMKTPTLIQFNDLPTWHKRG